MIEFKQITKQYPHMGQTINAIDDVSLKVNPGDIFGIIGFSGAGKSSLIRLVNALEQPSSGEVIVDGEVINQLSALQLRQVKQEIGMIFQHFNLLENKTVAENIALPLVLAGESRQQIGAKVAELLEYVELSDKQDAYPKQLSGGQKQRVGIARALVNQPKILLCDEATSALDPQTTQSILELLKRINTEQNITILMVTHEMAAVKSICNRIAVMEKGKVIEQGDIVEVFGKPQHPTTRNFVNAVIEEDLPQQILAKFAATEPKIIHQLKFLDNSAQEAVVNELILQNKVKLNILFANMIEINGTVLGNMFARISGSNADIAQAEDFLRRRGVQVTAKDYHHV